VIQTFKSKALKLYFDRGDASKLQPHHIQKIRLILGRLNLAKSAEEMNQPGYKFHKLVGGYDGFFSVSVNGNWRIIFRFDNEDAFDIDYLDYH
jgi:proteic killer suppression protein